MVEKKKMSRWRWERRVGLGVGVLVLIVGAIPFLFTTALTRWALGRSAYARFQPTIGSASLSLGGRLRVNNLEFHALAGANDVVASADTVTVTFSWFGVLGSRVQDICADRAGIFLREKSEWGTQRGIIPPLTVLDLVMPDKVDNAQASASAEGRPFWFDHLRVRGEIDAYDVPEFDVTSLTVLFNFNCVMHGDEMRPSRDFEVWISNNSNSSLSAKVRVEPKGEGTGIVIQELIGKKLHVAMAQAFADEMITGFPKSMREAFEISLGDLDVKGSMETGVKGAGFEGMVLVKGLTIASSADAKSKWGLTNLNVGGKVHGPSGAGFLSEGVLTEGKVSFDTLVYGKNEVTGFSTPVGISEGKLDAPKIAAAFAGGDFSGEVSYLLAEKRLGKASLHVAHLDQQQVAANLAPDKVNAEGTVSGTVELSSGDRSPVVGTIDLVADGAGRLQIKDEQTAEALAQKLETGAAAGVLPSNFSDIVVGQLKDYPYQTGHIFVAAPDGVPVITLNYHRDGVKAGEPGFGVKTTLAGQPVTANYTVQLPELSVVLKGKTITELLALAAGLEKEVAGEGMGK